MTEQAADQHPQLFLDCDGVLADFDTAAEQVFGIPSRQAEQKLGPKQFWRKLRNHEDFYGSLPLLPDARKLFDAVKHLNPIILTGCPLGGWAEGQKHRWAAAHFPGTRMITCMAREKRMHMKPGDVLVDDFLKYKDLWEDAGGIFIHHTSADSTIGELRRIGLL
jgi:hypothetical protein